MQQPDLTADQRASMLAQQEKDWPWWVELGKEGNPFATLCRHCYGRHRPPLNEICPRDPPPTDKR